MSESTQVTPVSGVSVSGGMAISQAQLREIAAEAVVSYLRDAITEAQVVFYECPSYPLGAIVGLSLPATMFASETLNSVAVQAAKEALA